MTAPTRRRRGGSPPVSTATAESMLRGELAMVRDNLELATRRLEESAAAGVSPFSTPTSEAGGVADLERQIITDPGWRTFAILAEREFSPDGLVMMRSVCRLMSLANPMIKRGLDLRAFYVWGQGCQIIARANGKNRDNPEEQDVQAILSAHIEDPGNQRSFYGQQAREENEHALGTDGDVFLALFTKPRTGWVQVRSIVADEITKVITNPEDRNEPWFYRRVWVEEGYDADGHETRQQREILHPDVDYRPATKTGRFAGVPVAWDAPVVHVPANKPKGWLRGIPDCYSVINWARAYKEFLEQWAGLMRSLSKFAWKLTAEGRQRDQAKAAMRAATDPRLRSAGGGDETIGGVAVTPTGGNLEAIPKSGAVIDAESGRPLAMQVAAGLNVPVTMLLGDPGQTGARATAETLDWPTELGMMARRELWAWAQLRVARYVIAEAVRAVKGPLKGKIVRDPVTGRETVTLAGETDTTVDVVWPPLDGQDPKAIIDAVVAANATGTLKPDIVLRLVLEALGVREAESIIDEMLDDEGNFQWPSTGAPAGPGQQAADLARAGGDPATAGVGSMRPDGSPVPPDDPAADPAAAVPTEEGVSADALARQADADFGLFGGKGAGDDAEQALDDAEQVTTDAPDQDADDTTETPAEGTDQDDAGALPVGLYDPAFFKL
jgi:hypothetical protein